MLFSYYVYNSTLSRVDFLYSRMHFIFDRVYNIVGRLLSTIKKGIILLYKGVSVMDRKVKKVYKNEKKLLKKEYKNIIRKLKIYYNNIYTKDITTSFNPNNPPKRSVLEEIGNSITHGLGSLFSILALILMLINSKNSIQIISAIIYFIGLFILFTMSCLYHSFKFNTKVKRLFRRFDYSSIYLLIGSTFIPILLVFVGGDFSIIFCIIQWIIIITGITFVCIFGPNKLRFLHIPLYIILGWSGLLLIPMMFKQNTILFYFILGGGIAYSIGIIPFMLKRNVAHFIWHLFVLVGAVIQWIGIFVGLYL